MPGLSDFAISKKGTQVNIAGKVVDDKGNPIADFGPDGTNFVPWFQQLTTEEQLSIVQEVTPRFVMPWLLKQGGG